MFVNNGDQILMLRIYYLHKKIIIIKLSKENENITLVMWFVKKNLQLNDI